MSLKCSNTIPCKDYDNCSWCCQHVKPCECGCGLLGGSCIPDEDETACIICERNGIPMHLFKWTNTRGEADTCLVCFNNDGIARLRRARIMKDAGITE